MSMGMLAMVNAKVVVTDVEGLISDFTLKARTVFFEKSLQYLVDHLGYPTAVKKVKYADAYLNGNFWIHNHHCYVVDISLSQQTSNFFFGLLNYSKSLPDYFSFLEANRQIDVDKDLEQLRSSLEASVISAVFEKTYRSTPEEAREIFEKCKDEKYGSEIRKKLVRDCRQALNYAMYECPEIRVAVMAKPSEYVRRDQKGISLVDMYRNFGSIILKSEWDFHYTNAMMRYVLNDSNWLTRFSAVLVGCNERWMDSSCRDKFLQVNARTGQVANAEIKKLCSGQVYTGGSADLLRRLLGVKPSVLYYQTADAVAMTKAIRNHKWAHFLQSVSETDCPGWEARVESVRPTCMSSTKSAKYLAQLLKMADDMKTEKHDELDQSAYSATTKEEFIESFKAVQRVAEAMAKAEEDAEAAVGGTTTQSAPHRPFSLSLVVSLLGMLVALSAFVAPFLFDVDH